MTRKQVAQRLGKSVATVRRLEGVLLHPREDGHGRYHFDATEVEQLAERIEAGEVAPWQHLRPARKSLDQDSGAASICLNCESSRARLLELEATMLASQEESDRRIAAAGTEVQRERSRYEAERANRLELEREFRRVVRFLESG